MSNTSSGENPLSIQTYTSSEPAAWSNSYLISGSREAFLFDVVQLRSEATNLADMVAASGKTLTTIVISHAHPDHFMGLDVLTERFPQARVFSTPNVVQDIKDNGPWMVSLLQGKQGADGPQRLVVPEPLTTDRLTIEGKELRVMEFGEGESGHMATLYEPISKILFCADVVYNNAHPYLQEKHLESWLAQLEAFEAFAKENVVTLYPGHGSSADLSPIAATRAYLHDFADAIKAGDATEAEQRMLSKYPDYHVKQFLTLFSIPAYLPTPEARK